MCPAGPRPRVSGAAVLGVGGEQLEAEGRVERDGGRVVRVHVQVHDVDPLLRHPVQPRQGQGPAEAEALMDADSYRQNVESEGA